MLFIDNARLVGYVLFIIVCAAFMVDIGWSIHYLFWRRHFAGPPPMRAPQLSYMRDLRHRELQELMASAGNTAEDRNETTFHDEFDEDCKYIYAGSCCFMDSLA